VNVLAVTIFLTVLALATGAVTLGSWSGRPPPGSRRASQGRSKPRALASARSVLWLTFALALVATLGPA
jgi:hypothetical protein